ncbi:chaplin [Streptomyces sp. NPDC101169]|uniref:chaplin n=1 Tax=unclassified Streptomyces TaxID=2593676 RepID=UPI003815B8F2
MWSVVVQGAGAAAAAGMLLVGGAGGALADSGARGVAVNSPGVLSGNVVQIPVHAPINVCGNTVNVIGALNPALGNACVNGVHRHGQAGPEYGGK